MRPPTTSVFSHIDAPISEVSFTVAATEHPGVDGHGPFTTVDIEVHAGSALMVELSVFANLHGALSALDVLAAAVDAARKEARHV